MTIPLKQIGNLFPAISMLCLGAKLAQQNKITQ